MRPTTLRSGLASQKRTELTHPTPAAVAQRLLDARHQLGDYVGDDGGVGVLVVGCDQPSHCGGVDRSCASPISLPVLVLVVAFVQGVGDSLARTA
jgi:hypothetical protein